MAKILPALGIDDLVPNKRNSSHVFFGKSKYIQLVMIEPRCAFTTVILLVYLRLC